MGTEGDLSVDTGIISEEDLEKQLVSPSASKLIHGLVLSEVQRLQSLLEETSSSASRSENYLREECSKLEGQVQDLQNKLNAASAASSPLSISPSPSERQHDHSSPLPVSSQLHHEGSIPLLVSGGAEAIFAEGSDDEFWELSILPDEADLLSRSVSLDLSKPIGPTPMVANDRRTLDDSAMESELGRDGDFSSHMTLVKISSLEVEEKAEGGPESLRHSEEDREEAFAERLGATVQVINEEDTGYSSASGDSLPDELGDITIESLQRDLDCFTDLSSVGGYTFGKADMEALMAEGESLQNLVCQLSAALEQADDDKFQLEEHLRKMILSKTLSQQETAQLPHPHDGCNNPPGGLARLPTQIRSLATKHESLYEELLKRLDQSRFSLHQSQEAQNQLRKMVDTLREDNETLRTALSATEAVLQLYKAKLDATQAAKGAEELDIIDKKLQSVEPWCLRAQKAVEKSPAPDMAQHQSYFDHLSRTSKSQVAEILALREENQHLTSSMASMSIKFAEADSVHTITKRALARSESHANLLMNQLQAAGITPAPYSFPDIVPLGTS
eukprot:CAMPEP_0117667794 /NCGR_PEP_ID=MMETSP0804-20121206/11173_1 /TAXON_ID=1074897 /ORGANISM="Tetraselmis astigmatica, Strain CCMP880" /LENGTH=560 /DNA_ID=CAMNT_0005475577 /DNA_START=213 /DNA_END=1895 /DNA_ORIENTATION=-